MSTTDFDAAKRTIVSALLAYKARKPRTNLLKCVWILVHETSPRYAEVVGAKPLAVVDGFALTRGGTRSGSFDQFPKEAIACLISIGDEQRAFPIRVAGGEQPLDGLVALDLLQALFDGAPDAEKPAILRSDEGAKD